MTKHPPMQPCFAIFHGLRYDSRPAAVEEIHQPVRIVEVGYGKTKELAVSMFGRQRKFPLAKFRGEWEVLEVTA